MDQTTEEKKEVVVGAVLRLIRDVQQRSTPDDFLRNDIRRLVDAVIMLGVDVMADVVGQVVGYVFSKGDGR